MIESLEQRIVTALNEEGVRFVKMNKNEKLCLLAFVLHLLSPSPTDSLPYRRFENLWTMELSFRLNPVEGWLYSRIKRHPATAWQDFLDKMVVDWFVTYTDTTTEQWEGIPELYRHMGPRSAGEIRMVLWLLFKEGPEQAIRKTFHRVRKHRVK